LSTHFYQDGKPNLATAIFPVMPRGVEHCQADPRCSFDAAAIFPVMPRGVEHRKCGRATLTPLCAIFPVMPRGVEHFAKGGRAPKMPKSDFSGDAARR